MKCTVGQLKRVIMNELGPIRGKLRPTRGGKQQHRIGKAPESENRELSSFEANQLYPGSVEAWAEVVPVLFPDFPFDDPRAIIAKTAWFKIGDELRVAFEDMPQIELAIWNPEVEDWFELEHG